ncbi:MAG: chemotaxis protein [Betaproteobacteria bacterium]|nr:chemotaxis protein [Betaproteobacteria bacterium]
MEPETHHEIRYKPNPIYVVLEIIGSIIMGIGLADALANTSITPQILRFENYAWYMVGIGFLLGVPHLNGLIRFGKSMKEKNANI